MVIHIYSCPHCAEQERVRRYGRTQQGSERFYCNVCCRAFTPAPKSRSLSEEKAEHILNSLADPQLSGREDAFDCDLSHFPGLSQHRLHFAQKKSMSCRLWRRPCPRIQVTVR